jgi:integrase
LWQRGRYWHEADPDDLLDWEAWRRRGQRPGRGIGGSKWQRELAALRLVYEWAEKEQRIARSPVLVHQVRLRSGGTATVADQAPRDVRSADVKWVTPRTYRLWRDTGLLGYGAGGQPDPSWRGRNDGRNAAFTDLLFTSELRLREGGCLLTLEVPEAADGHGYYEGIVAGAVAKRRQRMFYASAAAHRRYEQVPGSWSSPGSAMARGPGSPGGRARPGGGRAAGRDQPRRADTAVRRRRGRAGAAVAWLAESGMPMAYESWEKVFGAANARVEAVLASSRGEGRVKRTPVAICPHMLRHSFALHMLVALHHALDRRFGLTPEERKHLRQVYGDPWVLVRDLLGHSSEQTTRLVYLEPLNGLQVTSLLDHDEDIDTLLSRVAASSRLVIDAGPGNPL